MALELKDQMALALRDLLEGGWAKYLELEDGAQVRCTWHQQDDHRWLQAENVETGHVATFKVTVGVFPFELPPITEEAEYAEWENDKHPGGPVEEYSDPAPLEPPEPVERFWAEVCEGDKAQGGDGRFYEVVSNLPGGGPNAGKRMVMLDLGGEIGLRQYPFEPANSVLVIRGETGRAADTMRAAGLDPQVIKS